MTEEIFDIEGNAEEREEQLAQARKQLESAVASVLSTEAGRTVLKEILSYCQVEAMNAHDGAAAFRVEGARSVGLRTVNLLRSYDPDGFMKLYTELYCHDR